MARKRKERGVRGKIRTMLKKEVNLPIPLPKNKAGEFLGKKRTARLPKYFRESWVELRKVVWPTRRESWKLVLAVILFTLVFTLITLAADYGISQLVERILL